MSEIPDAGLDPLIGSWRLVSIKHRFSDTTEYVEPFGSDPEGRMVLEPGGRIILLFARTGREPPKIDADRTELFNSFAAYTGTVRMDGPGRFITHVDLAWHPAYFGDQHRLFEIAGNSLTVRTHEMTFPQYPGRPHVAEVLFMREN